MALWGAGFCPLHPPGLNPGGTYRTCQAGARSGALPLAGRGWVAFRYPAGGVAVLVARLPFTLALFLPPSPRPPSQREGGDSKFSYARGFAPCIPGAEPARHLQNLPSRCPEWGFAPCGTCYPCPGGEDHLKRRSSSPPVPPLLGCRHCSPVPRPNRHATRGHR